MINTINSHIVLKENLEMIDYEDINDLRKTCIEYDNTYLKLEIDFKLSNPKKNNQGKNLNINEFMFYDSNKLIGYVGICDFGGDSLEVNGMVHPDYRRRGIFTKLISLVKYEFNKRDTTEMLLLSDNNSISGNEFIKKLNCSYKFSEYDMNLDMDVKNELNINDIEFKRVTNNNVNKLKSLNLEFFDEYDYEGISDYETNEGNSSSATYVMEMNNVIMGKVRLEINNGTGGIYGLEVLPNYRGNGYGRKLLILSINKLKESNINIVTLQVAAENKKALNLYKSCGFKENYTMNYYSIKKEM